MKVHCVLATLLLLLAGGEGAPTGDLPNPTPDNLLSAVQTKENEPAQISLSTDTPALDQDRLKSEDLSTSPSSDQSELNEESEHISEDLLYDSKEADEDVSEYSASFPSWITGDFFDSLQDDTEKDQEQNAGNMLFAGIESALVNDKLEPLYRSISNLKTLLYQLRDKADIELQNIGESISGEEGNSFYSSVDVLLPSTGREEGPNRYYEKLDNKLDNGLADHQLLEKQLEEESDEISQNNSKPKLKSNAVESEMKDFGEDQQNPFEPGRRYKRDLEWGWGNRLSPRYDTHADAGINIFSSFFEEDETEDDSQSESSWSSTSSAAEESVEDENALPGRIMKFHDRVRVPPREETNWKDILLNLRGSLRASSQRLQRRRRNKEDIRAFINSMPTLEGMRKRTMSVDDDSADEPVIPDPGPLYPVPPNLPRPDNVIDPYLPPDMSMQWEPPPDFEEDNALLEEQTNGVEITNPFIKRYAYLKDVERSIMQESLQDLALELAGRHPLGHGPSLRVRRVMQIPPPPPYGRKVVKSLYRKKAYGYPFIQDEFSDELLPDPWESEETSLELPYGGYGMRERQKPHMWGEYLQFGRIEDPSGHSDVASNLLERLLSAINTKEAKDRILERLLAIEEVPPQLRREVLLQALVDEAESSNGVVDGDFTYPHQESNSETSRQWSDAKSDNEEGNGAEGDVNSNEEGVMDSNSALSNDISPTFEQEKMTEDNSDVDNDASDVEAGYFSEGSESESSAPDWGDIRDEFQSNIPQLFEEMKQHMLIQKLAEFLHRATSRERTEVI